MGSMNWPQQSTRYRIRELALMEMWCATQDLTSQILISLAHAQYELDADSETNAAPPITSNCGCNPLHICWTELHTAIRAAAPLRIEKFSDNECELLERGSSSVINFWDAIGLSFTPVGETFHIARCRS